MFAASVRRKRACCRDPAGRRDVEPREEQRERWRRVERRRAAARPARGDSPDGSHFASSPLVLGVRSIGRPGSASSISSFVRSHPRAGVASSMLISSPTRPGSAPGAALSAASTEPVSLGVFSESVLGVRATPPGQKSTRAHGGCAEHSADTASQQCTHVALPPSAAGARGHRKIQERDDSRTPIPRTQHDRHFGGVRDRHWGPRAGAALARWRLARAAALRRQRADTRKSSR